MLQNEKIIFSPQKTASEEKVGSFGLEQKIPESQRARFEEIKKSFLEAYPDSLNRKNQEGKFQLDIEKALQDEDLAEFNLDEVFRSWRGVISDAIKVAVKSEKTQENLQEGKAVIQVEQKDIQVEQKDVQKTQIKSNTEELTVEQALLSKNLTEQTNKLSETISRLSGGKPLRELIPDYDAKILQAEQELVSKGKDPKLAASVVLLSNEGAIFDSIRQTLTQSGKTFSAQDISDLRANFDGLRSIAHELKLPAYSPVMLAMRDPAITPETYTKIKAGFEPPSQTVWSNPKTGEYLSQVKPISGERTVMTSQGERFREKSGLRILSPIPENPQIFDQVEKLNLLKGESLRREKTTETIAKVAAGELAERFPLNQYPNLRLPKLEVTSAEQATKNLTEFFQSNGWKEFASNPQNKEGVQFIDNSLKKYFKTLESRDDVKKNLKDLEEQRPEIVLREQIKKQDTIADKNLSELTKIGLHHLGQTAYEQLIDGVNRQLKKQAIPPISDTKLLDQRQLNSLKRGLLALVQLSEDDAYPDGKLSRDALVSIQKVHPITAEKIDELLNTMNKE